MRLISIAFLGFLFACATQETKPVKTESLPFMKRYVNKDKELVYIVARTYGEVDEATKTLITMALKKFDPEIILTKYPAEETFQLQDELSHCEQGLGCSPVIWSCQAAKLHGIPCLTAEPYFSEVQKEVRKKGYKAEEVLFIYTYASLVSSMGQSKEPLAVLPEKIEETKKLLNIAPKFEKEDFIQMYKEKMRSNVIRINPENLRENRNGNYLQKLAVVLEDARHTLIHSRVATEMSLHKHMMVIFGPGYYFRHKDYIENLFSTPVP